MNTIISINEIDATEIALKQIYEDAKPRIDTALAMACTEETKQAVKKLRAELNKEFKEIEDARKAAIKAYEEPERKFLETYKLYIRDPFEAADRDLKAKISEIENEQKEKKTESVCAYACELLASYGMDWLDAKRIIPPITLSASEKSLKNAVKESVEKIKKDIDCIHLIDDSGEMFAEYINFLDLAMAKTTVERRKKAIEEAEKAKATYSQQEEVIQQAEEKVDSFAPPTVEEVVDDELTPEVYTMTFTATGTMEQLKALKAYMIASGIEFKNGGNNNG